MPRIDSNKVPGAGISSTRNKTFREKLMDTFAAHEWVRVINVDDETYIWQYLPAHNEEFEFTPDPMKITRRGEVEAYALEPGESEVIIGENAYVMIEGLYKKLAAKATIKRSPNVAPGFARSYSWDDSVQQDEFMSRIYLGKEDPKFGKGPTSPTGIDTTDDPAEKAKEALGINGQKPKPLKAR